MKFRVMMKDPDVLGEAISEAVQKELSSILELNDHERSILGDVRCNAALQVASAWFKFGEFVTIEIDTDTKTCVVCAA